VLGNTYDAQVCSISRTLEVFGERWTLLIMRNALFAESVRFGDFKRSLGIATNVLTARLAHLVEQRVMERVEQPGDAPKYRLTERGSDLATTLVALTQWGDSWAAPNGEPVRYMHGAGDHTVRARLVCDECGPLTQTHDLEALPGPGMPDDLAEQVMARHLARHVTQEMS
jgi:DNA-binding HxlR family transcriptional regulator